MRISALKVGIHEGLMFAVFDTNIDKLIVSCVMYNFLRNLSLNDTSAQNNIKALVSSYMDTFKNNFTMYKKKAITYNILVRNIENFRKNSFLEFTGKEIEDVNKLYQNKTQVVPFSTSSFSQYMYKVSSIDFAKHKRLSEIHFNIMCPIIRYYSDNNNISEKKMEIYDAEIYPDNPGKEIYFAISDVSSAKIVNDIKSNRISINSKLYLVEVKNPFVRIITK
jgi:hypothetical protein